MNKLNKLKHTVGLIDGVRCAIIETGASEERIAFLKPLLELNKYEVKLELEKSEDPKIKSYIIGVTDVTFNAIMAVYERRLLTSEGKRVTPAYWKQETDFCDSRYWIIRKKRQTVSI